MTSKWRVPIDVGFLTPSTASSTAASREGCSGQPWHRSPGVEVPPRPLVNFLVTGGDRRPYGSGNPNRTGKCGTTHPDGAGADTLDDPTRFDRKVRCCDRHTTEHRRSPGDPQARPEPPRPSPVTNEAVTAHSRSGWPVVVHRRRPVFLLMELFFWFYLRA